MGNIDIVIENPPYSHKYSASDTLKLDPRFYKYPLAPKSKADYMFLLDGLAQLSENGIMAILLPHGVLFRSGSEEKIRKQLVEDKKLRAVISLPEKIFASTDVPTALLIVTKEENEKVLFIEAKDECAKDGKRNKLKPENIEKILETYKNRMEVDKFSHLASLEEIRENEYNLNMPRYADTLEPPEPVDLDALAADIYITDLKAKEGLKENREMFDNLVGNSGDAKRRLAKLGKILDQLAKLQEEQIEADKVSYANWKEVEKKTEEPHIEEDGIPTEEYQQMTIDMMNSFRRRKEITEEIVRVAKELKEEFLRLMFV